MNTSLLIVVSISTQLVMFALLAWSLRQRRSLEKEISYLRLRLSNGDDGGRLDAVRGLREAAVAAALNGLTYDSGRILEQAAKLERDA